MRVEDFEPFKADGKTPRCKTVVFPQGKTNSHRDRVLGRQCSFRAKFNSNTRCTSHSIEEGAKNSLQS